MYNYIPLRQDGIKIKKLMEKNLDIFDYKNVIDILIGMSDEQKKTLAQKMVDRFPSTTYDLASEFMIQLQDKEAEEGVL